MPDRMHEQHGETPDGDDAVWSHRGRGPQGWRRSDRSIEEDVCQRLHEAGDLDASNIRVTVQGAEVTLEGSASSRAAKRLADDLAFAALGVRDVHNRLRVGPGPGHPDVTTSGTRDDA